MDKVSTARAMRCKHIALAVTAAFLPSGQSYALPTGEQLVAGDVTVTRPTAQTMQINQATQKGIVNWLGFSIGASEHVNITQPNASASLLNRVVGNNPSEIFGRLTANGRVFLVNPNGVLFAPGASVEVGSLFASSLALADQDFLAGRYQFSREGNAGSVVNQGTIITANGYTALIGPQVRNDGVIIANAGKVALAAGDRVSLDMIGDGLVSVSVDQAAFNASVVNTGTIQADGGTVFLKASSANALLDTVINTSGVIRAMSLVERNGEIVLDAAPNGGIVASGEMQGGQVSISGGSFHLQRLVPDPALLNGLIAAQHVDISLAGGMTVDGGQIHALTGQNIAADSLTVRAQDGGFATLRNESGSQVITVTGPNGMRIEGLNGGGASVQNQSGNQIITASGVGGIHIEATNSSGGLPGSAILGKPFFFGGPPASDSQKITTTRINVRGGSIQANEQDITATAGVIVDRGSISTLAAQKLSVHGDLSLQGGSISTSGGSQTITVTGGNLEVGGSGTNSGAFIASQGNQLIDVSGNISLRAGNGGPNTRAQITAGAGGATQTVSATGSLSIVGGEGAQNSVAGIFHNGSGLQKISAAGLELRGGTTGSGNAAVIGTTGGGNLANASDQGLEISGDIVLAAGNGGDALINGGSPSHRQTIYARNLEMSNGAGGNNSFAGIRGGIQEFHVTEDVRLTARSTGGVDGGVRIGSRTPNGADITLFVGRDLVLTSGSRADNNANIGSSGVSGAVTNTIYIETGGSVILNSGTGAGARIGTGVPVSTGSVEVRAGGDIQLNGVAQATAIRAGTVTLNAANISEASNGFIVAGTLNTTTGGNTLLTGPNQISNFSGFSNGALSLTNSGALTVNSFFTMLGNGTLINAGDVSVTGSWNSQAAKIDTTGNLTVTGSVVSNGFMEVDVDGTLTVAASGQLPPPTPEFPGFPGTPRNASLTSLGGQDIEAGGVKVTASDGAFATISNNGTPSTIDTPAQKIVVGGAGIEIRSGGGVLPPNPQSSAQISNFSSGNQEITVAGGGINVISTAGNASISNSGPFPFLPPPLPGGGTPPPPPPVSQTPGSQIITVTGGPGIDLVANGGNAMITQSAQGGAQRITATNAEHIAVDGRAGLASISDFQGEQTISIIGTGRNAITVGSTGALGPSNVGGGITQNVTAGLAGEQGSITIVGSDAQGALAGFVSNPSTGGTQTVSTSGTISVTGGRAAQQLGNFPAGIFHNGTGQQTITAAGLELRGGTTGSGNAAIIGSNGGGNLANAGDQRLDISGDIVLAAGVGGDALINGGLPGQRQTIYARNLEMSNGAGGTNSFAGIRGGIQEFHATEDVRLTARSTGGVDGGVRIGSRTPNGADIKLFVGGDLVLTGGSRADNNANIGSSGASGAVSNTIYVETGGSVILNSGTGAGARIGTGTAVSTGSVEIRAGGDIQLNGVAQATAIRAGTVTLNAANISEASNGLVVAGTLNTMTRGDTLLTGPNQISSFNGFSNGALSLNNSGSLTVSTFFAMLGSGTLTNAGDVSVTGAWNSQAAKIDTAGNLTVTGSVTSNGFMEVDVDGTLTVAASGQLPPPTPGFSATPRMASLTSLAGQDIDAGGIKVIASDGASATISNNGAPATIDTPAQKIVVGGAGIEVRSTGAVLPPDPQSSAQISNSSTGNQEITVSGGGINVISTAGNASIANRAPFLPPPPVGGTPPPPPPVGTIPLPPPPPATQTPGSQTITVKDGPGIDLVANGGSATITQEAQGGAQSITGINADHVTLDGRAGLASISNFQGEQTISVTGAGNNALRLGTAGGQGLSQVLGRTQSITAGDAARGEAGRIDLVGANAPSSFVGITTSNAPGAGNSQTVSTAGTITIEGGNSAFQNPAPPPANVTSSFTGITHNSNGQQTITAANLDLQGGAGINNGVSISSNQGGRQQVAATSITLEGGRSGTNSTAFISTSGGGDQTVIASGGSITITGGDGGTTNRAGILTNASQTIDGNPDIVLTGGAGGNGNNVFIQTTFVESPGSGTKPQTINARSIRLTSGAGLDASATLNAARQVITTAGNVSLFGGAGLGGTNGVRIGGSGGTTLGPTNLTLSVGGDLLLHAGTANGASVGSSGTSTQANIIAVTAGNITLESEGAGARIGSSGQVAVTPGNISVTAAGNLQLGDGAAIRANGPITLTANRLVNDGTITNGGGSDNMLLSANSYDLAGGSVQGGSAAVLLRPRDGTRSFGIEAAGDPTLTNHTNITNADIASISTSNFIVFGSGMGTNFTGNMTIGQDAQVNGGAKNLAFFRSTSPGGTTTIGSQGVTTTGDVIVSAGGGAIVSNGIGIVAGDEVQLRATQAIGEFGARVHTAANALTVGTSGDAFIKEANDVTLRTIALNVGGITDLNTTNTSTGGVLDLIVGGDLNVAGSVTSAGSMSVNAAGALNVMGAGTQDGVLTSSGGQTISAQSVNLSAQDGRRALIENLSGDQSVTATAGDMNLQVAAAAGVAQIVSNAPGGNQTVTVSGDLDILGGAVSSAVRNSGLFKNGAEGLQTVKAGSIVLRGAAGGTNGGAFIASGGGAGTQTVSSTGSLRMIGGEAGQNGVAGIIHNGSGLQKITAAELELRGGTTGTGNAAVIGSNGGGNLANAGDQRLDISRDIVVSAGNGGDALVNGGQLPGQRQTIYAHNIELSNGDGGTNSFSGIRAGTQDIHATGDVRLTAGSTNGTEGGIRIGSRTPNGADIKLFVGGDLVLSGGDRADNNANIGSPGASGAVSNTIYIEAGGNVILNSGTGAGARIGTGVAVGTGSVEVHAGGDIRLNGVDQVTAIRAGTVTLSAANISEGSKGLIVAETLSTTTRGDTLLTGPNQVSSFTAASESGNVSLTNTSGLLTLGSMDLPGRLSILQTGDVAVGAANAQSATVVMAAGDISIGASGAIAVRGSDTTEGAASSVISGGTLELNAGSVSLIGGAALDTPVMVRGDLVEMQLAGRLNVTGGSGQLSPAVLSSGSNFNLEIGDSVRLDAGSGLHSLARIQTEFKDGVINIYFPNLSAGGYFVNGVESLEHHGQTGFFTGYKPAMEGRSLLLTYGD